MLGAGPLRVRASFEALGLGLQASGLTQVGSDFPGRSPMPRHESKSGKLEAFVRADARVIDVSKATRSFPIEERPGLVGVAVRLGFMAAP
jgi:hypothetical protein